MEDFIFYNPTKILFGREQLNNLAKEIKSMVQKFYLLMVEEVSRKTESMTMW